MKNFYIGLDLGHKEIKLSTVEETSAGDLVVYNSSIKNEAFYRSEIIDQELFATTLENLFTPLLDVLQIKKIDKINIALNLPNFQSTIQKGHIIFENNVKKEDVERAIRTAKNFVLYSNQEIILEEPLKFYIDGLQETRDPIGFYGKRLDTEVLFISCGQAFVRKLNEIFKSLNIEILNLFPSTYISAKYFLSKKDKEIGTCVFEIGHAVTFIGVFNEGKLCYIKSFDWGAKNIFEDLCIYLKVDIEEIEKIKEELFKKEQKDKKTLKKKNINKFIEKKLKEYFDELKLKEILKDIKKQYKLPGGLTLFGSFLYHLNLENFLKNYFEMQTKFPKDELKLFDSEEDLLKFSASTGAALSLREKNDEEGFWVKIKNIFTNFFGK